MPDDGFTFPLTAEQQLRRLNRISAVLWDYAATLNDMGHVVIGVDPAMQDEQISLHLFGTDLQGAAGAADALGLDSTRVPEFVGAKVHHRWYGTLTGFGVRLVWIEEPAPVDTQGREDLPADAGTTAYAEALAAPGQGEGYNELAAQES